MNEVAVESAWQPLAQANMQTTWVSSFPGFERERNGRHSYEYEELNRLATALGATRSGAVQIHITEQTVNNQLTSNDHGSGAGFIRGGINITLRGSEAAQFQTLLPETSPNLHSERRMEHLEVNALSVTEDGARARAVARLIATIQTRGVFLKEEGSYYLNEHVVNTVYFTRQSLAAYLHDVHFASRHTTDPETGTPAIEATLSADVLDYELPQGHRGHGERGSIRPLFPEPRQ